MLRSGHLDARHELADQAESIAHDNLVKATYVAAVNYYPSVISNNKSQPIKTTIKALLQVLSQLRDKNDYQTIFSINLGVSYGVDRKITQHYLDGTKANSEPVFIISPDDLQQWYVATFETVDSASDLEFQFFFFTLYLHHFSQIYFYWSQMEVYFSKEFISDSLLKMGERLGDSTPEALKVINSKSDVIVGNILCEAAQKKFNLSDEEKRNLRERNQTISNRRIKYKLSYENSYPEIGPDCFQGVVYENGYGVRVDIPEATECYLKVIMWSNDTNEIQFALERVYKLLTHQSVLEAVLQVIILDRNARVTIPLLNAAIDSYQAIIDSHFTAHIDSSPIELEKTFNGPYLDGMYVLISLGLRQLSLHECGKSQPVRKVKEAELILYNMIHLVGPEVSISQYEAAKLVLPRLTEQTYKPYRQRLAIKNYRQRIYELVYAFQKELFATPFTIYWSLGVVYGDPKNVQVLKGLFGRDASNTFTTADTLFPSILEALRVAMQGTSARTEVTAEFYVKWLAKFENISFLEVKNPTNSLPTPKLNGKAAAIRIMAKNQQAFDLKVNPSEVLEALDVLATEADSAAIEFLITNLGYTAISKEGIVNAYFQLSAEDLAAFYLEKFKNVHGIDAADLDMYFYTFIHYLFCYAAVFASKFNLPNALNNISKFFAQQVIQNIKKLESKLGDTIQDALRDIANFDDEVLIKFYFSCAVKKFNLTDAAAEHYYTQYKNTTRRMASFGVNYDKASSALTDEYLLAYAFECGLNRPSNLMWAAQRYINVIKTKENAESVTEAINRLTGMLPAGSAICAEILQFYVNTVDLDPRERALLSAAVDEYQEVIDVDFKAASFTALSDPSVAYHIINQMISMQTLLVNAQRTLCLPSAIGDEMPLIKAFANCTLLRLTNLDDSVKPELIQQAEQVIPELTQQVITTYRQQMTIKNYHDRMRALLNAFKHELYTQHFDIAYAGFYISGDPKTVHAFKEIFDSIDLNDEQSIRLNFPKIFDLLKETLTGNSYRRGPTDRFYNKWLAKFEDLQFIYQGLNPDLVVLAEVENLKLSDLYLVWKQKENVGLKIKLACGIRLFKLDPNFKQEFIETLKTFPLLQSKTTYTSSGFGFFGDFSEVADAEYTCIYAIAFANAALNTKTDLSRVKDTVKDCFTPNMTKALSSLPNFLTKTFLNMLARSRYWPASITLPAKGSELEQAKEQFKQLVVTAIPFDFDLGFQSLCKCTPLGSLFDKVNGALSTTISKGSKFAILEALAEAERKQSDSTHIPVSSKIATELLPTTRHNIAAQFSQDRDSLKFIEEKYPAVFKIIDEVIRAELTRKKAKAPVSVAKPADELENGDPRASAGNMFSL